MDQIVEDAPRRRRASPRGALTRERIVEAADSLMFVRGVNATTLDDVRAASGTSKSQLYNAFADKEALVRAVVDRRARAVIERETGRLAKLASFSGLVRWRNALVEVNSLQGGAYGCGLGAMALELSDQDEQARTALAEAFAAWEQLIADGLRRMQSRGTLSGTADPDRLAIGLMAALQGAYLLANAAHDMRPMEIGLDMALDHIKSLLVT